MVRYAYALEEGIKFLVFPSPIRLDSNNLTIKLSFNKCLKVLKNLKDIGSFLKEIDPCVFAVIIYETHIIILFIDRITGRPPYIGKMSSKGAFEVLLEFG